MPTVGDNLGNARRLAKLTQEQLAEAAELSVETIRKIEQGERTPRLSTLNTIARALRTTTSALLGDASANAARRDPDADDIALVDIRPATSNSGSVMPTGHTTPINTRP